MKNRYVGLSLLLGILTLLHGVTYAQVNDDDLYIFGFSQVIFNHRQLDSNIYPSSTFPAGLTVNSNTSTFALHQVNLFFQKSINSKTTFFLNFEASGSYSSRLPSGEFEIPEGWISFKLSDGLSLKTGLLLPRFNNLTEIKNRLPLFPYIIRPIVYEALLSNIFKPEDYKPQSAYFQLSGDKKLFDNYNLNYAFFIGNAENSFLSSIRSNEVGTEEESTTLYRGENLNTALAYGGRIGIENYINTKKFGVSFTIDEDNKTKPENSVFRLPKLTTPILGEIPRYRLGIDLSFTHQNLSFESEYMGVFHDHSNIRNKQAFQSANLNKFFAYGNVTYDFTEKLYAFGYISYNSDNTYEFVAPNSPSKAGIKIISTGGGWRINEVTIFKFQLFKSQLNKNPYLEYNFNMLTLGISTIF